MRAVGGIALCVVVACGGNGGSLHWDAVLSAQPTSLLSVWGTDSSNVFVVGGDANDGNGPVALHYDGTVWTRVATGVTNTDLWWTFGFADGTVFASGVNGTILRYDGTAFAPMMTPGQGTSVTVFGMWGATSDDVWAVGGVQGEGGSGFVWHYDGTGWTARSDVPSDVMANDTVFKVAGRSATDVWMVGSSGVVLHWGDESSLDASQIPIDDPLLSVAGMSDRFVTVGGSIDGKLYENADGTDSWASALPPGGPRLNGVAAAGTNAFAVGRGGTVLHRTSSGWQVEDTGHATTDDLHAAFIDDEGGVWAVGGQFDDSPTKDGVLLYAGSASIGGEIQ